MCDTATLQAYNGQLLYLVIVCICMHTYVRVDDQLLNYHLALEAVHNKLWVYTRCLPIAIATNEHTTC